MTASRAQSRRRAARSAWGTRANAITAVRAVCAPALASTVVAGWFAGAAVLFALAVATDFLDGRVARARGEASALGGLLDHAADAFFVTTGNAALAWIGMVPSVLPVLVALAFLQYAVDSRVDRGGPLRASRLGRWNGIAYYVVLGIGVGAGSLGLLDALRTLTLVLGWVLVATTGISMADRLRGSRTHHPA